MDDQEYQEIKRRWDNKHSEINKLIAYCEELRAGNEWLLELNTRVIKENAKLKEELNEAGLNW